jgi:virulence-associated protein VapD
MFNVMIRGFKRELEWYNDDYDLLKDFFEQDDFCMIYDIQALHRFTKQNCTRTSDLLVGVLGPLQSSIIIVKITEFSKGLLSTYTTTLDNVYRNQSLTLRHYWTAVKTACRPTTYPALSQYSWYCADTRSKNFTSTEHAFDRIHDDFMAGILALPMPSPLVRMLRLDESDCLEKVVHQQEQRLSQAAHVLFTMLTDPQKASFSRLYRDMEECLKQTAVLVKQAAHACYPTMSSWMTEVIEWGKQTDQIELVKSVVREVKLFYLVVDSTAHSVLGNQGGAFVAPIGQRLTFQEHLIEKAIRILT